MFNGDLILLSVS